MRRLLILVLSIAIFTACQSVTTDSAELYVLGESDRSTKPTSSGGSAVAIDDDNEFRQVLKEHANYGRLFESIMDNFEDELAVFDDYVSSEETDFLASTFSDIRDQLALDFIGTGNFDMDTY